MVSLSLLCGLNTVSRQSPSLATLPPRKSSFLQVCRRLHREDHHTVEPFSETRLPPSHRTHRRPREESSSRQGNRTRHHLSPQRFPLLISLETFSFSRNFFDNASTEPGSPLDDQSVVRAHRSTSFACKTISWNRHNPFQILTQDHTVAVNNGSNKENMAAADSWEHIAKDPIVWVDRVSAIFKQVKPWQVGVSHREVYSFLFQMDLDGPPIPAPWIEVASALFAVLSKTLQRYQSRQRTVEHVCRSLRCVPISSRGISS